MLAVRHGMAWEVMPGVHMANGERSIQGHFELLLVQECCAKQIIRLLMPQGSNWKDGFGYDFILEPKATHVFSKLLWASIKKTRREERRRARRYNPPLRASLNCEYAGFAPTVI